MTRQQKPNTPWLMLLAFLATVAVFGLLGLWLGYPVFWLITGVLFGILAAVIVLGRLAQKAAYGMVRGQAGAAGAALMNLGRGWNVTQEPVAAENSGMRRAKGGIDLAKSALVFRAVGRPGVLLTAEGPKTAANRLLEAERRRIARIVGESVPVHTYWISTDEGGTDISDLPKRVKKLGKKLTNAEVTAVSQRLESLGGLRQQVPAGMDPTRPPRGARRAMRGH